MTSLTSDVFGVAVENHLSTQSSCIGTDVYQVVGSPHDLLVVLHHHHRVTQILQILQHMDQTVGIPGMQADTRLVEDIERTHQRTTQTRTEVDTLTLTTREGVGETVERQITQSHVQEELQPALHLRQQTFAYLLVMFVEFQAVEPFLQPHHGHLHEVGDAPAANLHVVGLRLQSGTVTCRTRRPATIARQHHAVLDLILARLHHLEELVDTRFLLGTFIRGQTVPQPVFLLLRQVHIRLEDGEVVCGGMAHEPLLPLLHLLSMPAHHATVIY